ncbi:MAG TPA: ABC transporter permease [Gemmatimonadales bacterium]|nr:ABC transporter permease [Gemmatimonadales bacterium]
MLIGETVTVAFQSIRANKLRAALTMLGIIIGVGAVITMVALGSGAQKSVEDRINALGANLLTIFAGQSFMGGFASGNRVSLTTDDAAALDSASTTLAAVVPEISGNLQIKYADQNFNLSVTGTTPNYIQAHNYTMPYGQMFTRGDDDGRQRYAVLGASLPEEWGQNPVSLLHQMIHIRGIPFEIIGILSPKGAQGFSNPDEQILIPLQTAKYRIFGSDRLRSISVEIKDGVPPELAMVDIERVMRRKHKIAPGADDDFQIRNQSDILATQQQATQVFTALLASIAAVSLIVGGIGIMNIMLVSVTERTKEIGIRKALGASRGTILFQFLIEALVLCLTGGILGILLGVTGAVVLAKIFSWNTLISPVAIAIAFVFSGAVGLFFGLWPAKRAASLDPVEALRYE